MSIYTVLSALSSGTAEWTIKVFISIKIKDTPTNNQKCEEGTKLKLEKGVSVRIEYIPPRH